MLDFGTNLFFFSKKCCVQILYSIKLSINTLACGHISKKFIVLGPHALITRGYLCPVFYFRRRFCLSRWLGRRQQWRTFRCFNGYERRSQTSKIPLRSKSSRATFAFSVYYSYYCYVTLPLRLNALKHIFRYPLVHTNLIESIYKMTKYDSINNQYLYRNIYAHTPLQLSFPRSKRIYMYIRVYDQ